MKDTALFTNTYRELNNNPLGTTLVFSKNELVFVVLAFALARNGQNILVKRRLSYI